MLRCADCQARLLDHLYGLLDSADSAAVESHLAGCPECQAALVASQDTRKLFAKAALLPFPDVRFVPPVEATPAVRKPVRFVVPGYVIAATLLIAAVGVLLPAANERVRYEESVGSVKRTVAAAEQAKAEVGRAKEAVAAARKAADEQVEAIRVKHDAEAYKLVNADVAANATHPLSITVTGPSAAVPGAPNVYSLTATADGKPVPVTATVAVRDAAGQIVKTLRIVRGEVRLPADLWADRPNGADDLFLTVTATDPKTGTRADLREPLKLLAPIYTTLLTTDRPLYRPGDPVYFRSLTLDRTRFLPPEKELGLRYELRKRNGEPIEGIHPIAGRAEPGRVNANGVVEPILGPDGKPVRGVGCGAFHLPATLPGGEYQLLVKDVAADDLPLATRRILVQQYAPEQWLKTLEFDARSYGPGDTVTAKLTVRDQSKPAAGISVLGAVTGVPADASGLFGVTDSDGSTSLKFTLPKSPITAAVSLSVRLIADPTETIVRPVPLATTAITVEFFPEGGDLIAGVRNRVYFRATTAVGSPADIAGYLSDGVRSITPVRTLTDADNPGANQGHGVFMFTPEIGKRYSVRLLRPSNAVEPVQALGALIGPALALGFPLPAATDGVSLSIPNGTPTADEPIRLSLYAASPRKLLVGAYSRGIPVAHSRVELPARTPTIVTLTPKPGSVGGVTRVTVFEEPAANGQLTPVAERLIFRRPAEKLNLALTPDRPGYAPGDKATIGIAATTEADTPTAAILWAAVVNQSVITAADDRAERTLPTHFLLAGEVQSPDKLEFADFLLTPHPRAAEALDLLLGTQGWRRFAEQSGRFRATVNSDRDQYLISTGAHPTNLTESLAVDGPSRTAFDAVARELTAAQAKADGIDESAIRAKTDEAVTNAERAISLGETAASMETGIVSGRGWRMSAATGILAVAVLLVGLRLFGRAGPPVWASLVLAAVGGFAVAIERPVDPSWRDGLEQFKKKSDAPAEADSRTDLREWVGNRPAPIKPPPAKDELEARFRAETDRATSRRPNGINGRWNSVADSATRHHKSLKEGAELTPAQQAAARRVERSLARPPLVVREYAHVRKPSTTGDDTRTDFADTAYWHPVLVLPTDGRGSIAFDLPDAVTGYRVLVAGHTLDGRLGSVSQLIEVRKPLTVAFKLPTELTVGDRVDLPVTVTNGTTTLRQVTVSLWSDKPGVADETKMLTVPERGAATVSIPFTATATGLTRIRVNAAGNGLTDAVERTTTVMPSGFPVSGAVSGTISGRKEIAVELPNEVQDLTAKITVFTDPLGELKSTLDGLLKEPHGCFEQSSAANYPNVLILDYLRETGKADDAARGLLDRGYNRLVGYEVPRNGVAGKEGFEWFGQHPPHGPLTAYGLMQFADMARVHPVDPAVLKRTKEHLLSRRTGTGGFKREKSTHAFGDVSDAVADAYTLWAITESERGHTPSDLTKEVDAAVAGVGANAYLLALTANTLLNRADPRAESLLKSLASKQATDGGVPGTSTITRSSGPDATTETTALAALAWTRGGPAFAANAANAVRALVGRRGPGGTFGATQATVMTLKAITGYRRVNHSTPAVGELSVRIGGKEVGTAKLAANAPAVVTFADTSKVFPAGETRVEVFTPAGGELPFSLDWSGRTLVPRSDAASVVELVTKLSDPTPKEGNTVRLTVQLRNKSNDSHGMAVAVVGLPAGLRLPADAKQLSAEELGLWESTGRELTLYWRGLAAGQTANVSIDLIADVPGEYRGPASRAYLYYHPQAVTWAEPLSVRINR